MPSEARRTMRGEGRIGWAAFAFGLSVNLLTASPFASADYGRELACVRTIEKPGVMDAVVSGNHLFFIGSGHLYVAGISDPSSPQLIADCAFRGQGRQLAVADGIAYVTARASGVYIIDVHDPRKPEMLCHFSRKGIFRHG